MRRIGLAVVLTLSLTLAPRASGAQPVEKVYRIGCLMSPSSSSERARVEAFRQGLRDLGYAEGRNIVIEYRYADGKAERLPALAAELVRLRVDLILTAGDFGIRAAKEATTTIPIVVAIAGDLVGPGYAASLARPGGNITGLTSGPTLFQKRLELLKAAFPKIARVALFWNPGNAVNVTALKETETAAQALGVRVLGLEVRRGEDLDGAFQGALRDRADAVIGIGDTVLLFHRARIVEFAAKNRLPAMYSLQEYMDDGGLMMYGPNVADMYRRAATFVGKILKGARPGDLPIEQPTRFSFIINMKTAKVLGLTIPPSVLGRADQVIE
jgi:putative ABC transport system substrate-binding protein